MTILFILPLSNLLAACGSQVHIAPDTSAVSTTLAITVDQQRALVEFREGLDVSWKPATMRTPICFEAEVHGPYMVAVVCKDRKTHRAKPLKIVGTPDDPNQLSVSCDLQEAVSNEHTGSQDCGVHSQQVYR